MNEHFLLGLNRKNDIELGVRKKIAGGAKLGGAKKKKIQLADSQVYAVLNNMNIMSNSMTKQSGWDVKFMCPLHSAERWFARERPPVCNSTVRLQSVSVVPAE